jgi:hypothetical protein
MPSPTAHRPARKRNANSKAKPSHKHAPPRTRLRNAGAPRAVTEAAPSVTNTEALSHLVQTLIGTTAASLGGAAAVRFGFHPLLVSSVLAGSGGLAAWGLPKQSYRFVALGAASAASSQLVLMGINPRATAIAPASLAPQPPQLAAAPAHAALPVRPKNADLGSLPPGMLDAAFERARSELAVASDGYPHDYAHAHHHMP